MKILVVSPSYKPAYVYGGPIRSIAEMCEGLKRRGEEVTVHTTTANGPEELQLMTGHPYKVENVSVIYFKRWTGDHSHFSPGLLTSVFLRCRQYNVVHIQSWWNLVSVLAAVLCIIRGIRPVISLRGTLSAHSFGHNHSIGKRVFHNVVGRNLLKKSFLHVTSPKESIEVERMVPNSRSVMLPNILPLSTKVYASSVGQKEALRLLFVGRIHPIKNLELLIDALKQMENEFKYELYIVGNGDRAYVDTLMARATALPHITWLGELDGEEKYRQMANADILVLLSYTENFGNVVIEALSQGTAVLVTQAVGISDYIAKNQLGWVIEPTIVECTRILKEITRNKNVLESIRFRSPDCIARDFNPENMITRYVRMYQMSTNSFEANVFQ